MFKNFWILLRSGFTQRDRQKHSDWLTWPHIDLIKVRKVLETCQDRQTQDHTKLVLQLKYPGLYLTGQDRVSYQNSVFYMYWSKLVLLTDGPLTWSLIQLLLQLIISCQGYIRVAESAWKLEGVSLIKMEQCSIVGMEQCSIERM